MTLLETNGLTKSFNGLTAVDGVDVGVRENEFVCVIGPNGAGKTTFVNLITGLLTPTSGDVIFKNKKITDQKPHEIVQRGISRSFQTASLFPELTVEENIKVAAVATEHGSFRVNFHRALKNYPEVNGRTQKLLDQFQLSKSKTLPTKSLSYGDKRRLEMAVGMTTDPDLMFMDEPTAGMSPEETKSTTKLITKIQREKNMSIVMIEHDIDLVFELADRIIVLNRGSVIAEGTPDQIRNNTAVQKAYLGGVEQ